MEWEITIFIKISISQLQSPRIGTKIQSSQRTELLLAHLPHSEPVADEAWVVQQLRADELEPGLRELLQNREVVLVLGLDVDQLPDGGVRLENGQLVVPTAAADRD